MLIKNNKRILNRLIIKNKRAMVTGVPSGAVRAPSAAPTPAPKSKPRSQPASPPQPAKPAPRQSVGDDEQRLAEESRARLRELEENEREEENAAQEKYEAKRKKLDELDQKAQMAEMIPEAAPFAAAADAVLKNKKSSLDDSYQKKLAAMQQKTTDKMQNASTPTPPSSGGGNSGLFKKLGSGDTPSGSDQRNPWGTVILIILCALGAAFVFYTSDVGFSNVWPALISFALFIVGLLFLLYTRGNRGIIMWLVIIIIFVLALYFFATRTFPHVAGAVQASGGISAFTREVVYDTERGGTRAGTSIVEDIRGSYRRQLAVATGERLDGNVDESVRDEVGIEILPPYLPNPKKINQPEIPTLEFSSRIKGFDPKTPIHVAATCHIQSKEEADSSSLSSAKHGGPRTSLGDEQTIRPDSFEEYTFDREVTCYPSLEPSACGDFVITLSAQADNLRTDARMVNYIISEDVLKTQLMEYAKSKDIELTSEGQVASAINELYRGELGDFRSVSDKGSIKVVMATIPVPLIGINPDAQLDFKLRVAVENVLDGWIRGINSLEVIVPEYFSPLPEFCRGWSLNGNVLSLSSDSLSRINFEELAKGEQKVFPSCLLVPSGVYELTEPTEATFLAAVNYNYLVQEQFALEIRDADGQECGRERER